MTAVLTIEDLVVRFGGVTALDNVTLDVQEGELVAVTGPNGAGKTSLLNAICGLSRGNAAGRIDLYGQPTRGKSPVAIARAGVARTFQDPPLIDSESVVENLLVGAHLSLSYGLFRQVLGRRSVVRQEAAARSRAMELLELVGLKDAAAAPAGSLPYGARKLIDVARALMSTPRILLLDEPTSGSDLEERQTLQRLLIDLRARGLSMLVVEHHMDVVRATADRVIGLQAGRVLLTGTPSEVLDSASFREAVVGRGTAHESSEGGL
jgi:ABC-type branched-subunit amino acid transport system ATPase component